MSEDDTRHPGRSRRDVSRREALIRLAAGVPLLAAGLACRDREAELAAIRARAATYDPGLDCTDAPGLFPAETRTRTDNEYTDDSPHEDRYCFTCANFVRPEGPDVCAACTTVKGPIHPLGWCKAWAEGRWKD